MNYNILGIMSGTSLDGIDLCLVNFQFIDKWKYKIIKAETIKYSKDWTEALSTADSLSGRDLSKLDVKYGQLLGKEVAKFIQNNNTQIDLIASHGHTVFHEPHLNYSKQIGHAAYIAAKSGLPTAADFRSTDLAYGGQGAPLVPFGDIHLFPDYNAWLNIGGIANICIKKENEVIAFDIAAANMVLNYISQKHLNIEYDKDGIYASQGNTKPELLEKLEQFDYYQKSAPKSLGKEDIFKNIIPIIDNFKINPRDILKTYNTHLCKQIIKVAKTYNIANKDILISGGGANNNYLITLLSEHLKISLPDKMIIEFKEALIFAFLGLNRLIGNANIISTVTGASKSSIAGNIYLP